MKLTNKHTDICNQSAGLNCSQATQPKLVAVWEAEVVTVQYNKLLLALNQLLLQGSRGCAEAV
jgi:hypothetical protein